jgi:hypothetical protein
VNALEFAGKHPAADRARPSKAGAIILAKARTKALAKAWAPGAIPFEDIDERRKRLIESTPARPGGTPVMAVDGGRVGARGARGSVFD